MSRGRKHAQQERSRSTRGRTTTPSSPQLSLDGAFFYAFEEEALEGGEDDDDGDEGDHRAGRDQPGVVGEGAGQVLQTDRQRVLVRVRQHDQRPEEVVPGTDERED